MGNTICTVETLFLHVLNLGISAGWMIVAIIVLRFVLRKTPKRIMCLLWILVGIRLIAPVMPESRISLVPSAETVPETIMLSEAPSIESGIPAVDTVLNPIIAGSFAPDVSNSVNPMQIIVYIASRIWVVGIAAMLFYLIFTCLRLNHEMSTATLLCDNVFQSEFIDSPFILGIIKSRIFVPYGMSNDELTAVLAHEQAHIMRRDHWLKPAAFVILSVYWFNPMVWAAYILLCRDVEFACDECVIRNMDFEQRREYSMTLLNCIGKPRIIAASPLAFGEIGIKQRILRIKAYRKPMPYIIITVVIACAVTVVCFMTNPSVTKEDNEQAPSMSQIQNNEVQNKEVRNNELNHELNNEDASQEDATQEDAAQTPIFLSSDEAINHAILQHNQDIPELTEESDVKYPTTSVSDQEESLGRISCCSFVTLDTISATPARDDASNTHIVTYYGWALYQRYNVSDIGIEEISGSHIPVALTFEINEYGYTLKEYWEPGEGSKYIPDITNKFPVQCINDAIDSQKFIVAQKQSCYEQAVIAMNIDTGKVIECLLSVICEEPETSSNPKDYIDAHYAEFRELIYYKQYTIDYFMQKDSGNAPDTLENQILQRACQEIQIENIVNIDDEEEPQFMPLM